MPPGAELLGHEDEERNGQVICCAFINDITHEPVLSCWNWAW